MLTRTRSRLATALAMCMLMSLSACGTRYVPGTSPQQAIAYELNEGLSFLLKAQTTVIAAVDANPAIKPTADQFLNPVRTAFELARDQVIPKLEQYDAAVKLGNQVAKVQLSTDLKPLLTEFQRLLGTAFRVQLPGELPTAIAGFVAEVHKTLTALRQEFQLASLPGA
jgi:hypothetical protein